MAVVYPTTDDPNVQPVHPGLLQEAETHPIWAVVILGVLAVAGYALFSRLRGSSSSATPTAAQTPTTLYVPTRNDFINISGIPGPAGPPGPPGPPGQPGSGQEGGGNPPTQPIPQPGYNGVPLIPWGDYHGPSYSAGQFHWGQEYTYNGVIYEEGPGSNGALWGVPLKPGESPFNLDQWNQIPIAPGGKVLLYGPQSDYGAAGASAQSGALIGSHLSANATPPVVFASNYSRSKPVTV